MLLCVTVIFWKNLQQLGVDIRVQEPREMRHHQEEQNLLQGVSAEEVSGGGDVQEWFKIRPKIKLVQDTLSSARTAANPAPEYDATQD